MNTKFKKIITSIILVVMLFNFIGSTCYAADEDTILGTIGGTAFSAVDGVVGVLTAKIRILMLLVMGAVQGLTSILGHVDGTPPDAGSRSQLMITVEDIFFNRLNITKIDFFNMDSTSAGNLSAEFRQNVAIWYYVLRNLAIIILLCILIYVGIRMAISTVASEKAMYKTMFKDWVVSFILVFFMHYIIVVTLQVNNSLVELLSKSAPAPDHLSWGAGYMNSLFINAVGITDGLSAVKSWSSALVYSMMVFVTLAFLWTYVKRMITLAFLVIISPLVTVTYAIDKMGDGKSQALNTWLKEFIYNVLLQPFQCIIYLALMKNVIEKLTEASPSLGQGALAIICMMFIFSAEKIVRKIFGFDKASTIADTMATTAAIISTASNIKKVGPKGRSPAGSSGGSSRNAASTTNAGLTKNNLANKNIDKMKQQLAANPDALKNTMASSSNPLVSKASGVVGGLAGGASKASNAVSSGINNMKENIKEKFDNAKQNAQNLANSDSIVDKMEGNARLAALNLGSDIKDNVKDAVGSVGNTIKNLNTTAGATQAAMTMVGVAAGLSTGNAANAVTYGMAGNEIGAKMSIPAQDRYRERQERKFADSYKDSANAMEKLKTDPNENYDLNTEEGKENMKKKCKDIAEKGPDVIRNEFKKAHKAYTEQVKQQVISGSGLDPNRDKSKINAETHKRVREKYNEILNGNMDNITNEINSLKSDPTNLENMNMSDSLYKFAMAAKEKELSDNLARMMGIEEALGDSNAARTVITGENSTIDRINSEL